MNKSGSKYYPVYTLSATDYNDAAMSPTYTQLADTYSSLTGSTLTFSAVGTTTVTANNRNADVSVTTAYLNAASFDFTNRNDLVTDNDHELRTNNAPLTGFGTTNIARLCWQKYTSSWSNSGVAKWICNGFKSTASKNNYWQFYSGYGVNVTNNETMTAQGSAAVEGMYTCLTYKLNESNEPSGDGSENYNAATVKTAWANGSTTATLLSRDNLNDVNGAGAYKGAIYTVLDVYVPDGTTVTPTINATYGISTFSYPYALDLSELSGMTAWVATSAETSTIKLTKVTGVVPAGTPLILQGTAEAIPLADVSNASTIETNYLKPVLDNDVSKTVKEAAEGSTNYVLIVRGAKVVFASVGSTSASVPYGNAYMNVPSAGDARTLSIVFGDNMAEIKEVRGSELESNENCYDLMGRRVDNPSKGLYIVNGKKYMVK